MLTESEQNLLRPIHPDEFLPPISRWTTLGGLFLVATFWVAIALAAITNYKVTVKASASIRPSGELRIIQAAAAGTVKSILARENQVVKQGEAIAYLDDSRLQTQKSQLQSNLQQNQRQVNQIDAQIMALDRQITAERDRTQGAIISAQAELNRSQRDYQDQQITTTTQFQEAEANLKQAQKELEKTQAQLKSAQANLKSTEAALNAAGARRDRYKPIAELGALSQDQFQEAQLAVEQQKQALEAQKATVEVQKQDIERQEQVVEAALARRKQALATLNPSDAGVAIAQEKIAQENATRNSSLSRLNQEQEQLIQHRVELQNQLNRDQKELQQIETELTNTVIRASASGIIQQLNLRNTEQVVNLGDAIAQIAPSEAPLVIKAMVPSQEIGKVKIGQTVQMRVSACPYPDYGTLLGTVSTISPDAIPSQNNSATTSQGTSNSAVSGSYQVTIQPERLKLRFGGRECVIQSGMEGRADIVAKEETVMTFILRKARLLTDWY